MRRFTSLRWRLFLTYLPLVLVATTALAASLLVFARGLYLDGIHEQLAGQARLVGTVAAPRWGDAAGLDATAKRLGRDLGNRVTIVALDGAVLGDSEDDPARMDNHADRPEVRQALATGDGRSTRASGTIGSEFLYAAAPIERDGRVVGVARVARPLDEVDARLGRLRAVALLGVGVSGALAAGLTLLLARYITYPINALTALAGAMAAGRFDRRSEPRSADEIGRLERAFNRMADELQGTIGLISDERGKLAAILETMGDGVLMIDRHGTIVLANSAAERLLAPPAPILRDAQEAAGPGDGELRDRAFIEVARDHELTALVRGALDEGRVRDALIEFSRPRRTLRAVATPLRGTAESLVLLVLQDLTEMRRLETARRDFVANISHELRTPLASVKALVETLEDGAIEDKAVARHFLHQVSEEVDHLTQLVRELLELSRIESGQVPLRHECTAPADLILPTVARLRAQAERAGLRLTVAPLDGLPAVLVDRDRIGQVLLNLLHNAIKFTPPGGTITVAAEQWEGTLAISVRDTGTGIDPDDLPRIFERFYKADKARSGGGTGLGLAIAKHLIGAHGGTLSAHNNTDGPGATFVFTLPVATATIEERAD